MGLLGGWWGVAAVAFVAAFLAREVLKYSLGVVALTPRQKVVRVTGGVLLMLVVLMTVYSPVALRPPTDGSRVAQHARELLYWASCLGMSVLMMLMAVMDASEVSRQYLEAHRALRRASITQTDVERLIQAERKDHPDEMGRDDE